MSTRLGSLGSTSIEGICWVSSRPRRRHVLPASVDVWTRGQRMCRGRRVERLCVPTWWTNSQVGDVAAPNDTLSARDPRGEDICQVRGAIHDRLVGGIVPDVVVVHDETGIEGSVFVRLEQADPA